MATTTKESSRDPAKEMLLNNTMGVLRAFLECSDAIQKGVLEMAQILSDDSTDEDEKAAAADTMIESLYPQYHEEELGIDSAKYDDINRKHKPEIESELDQQEATFSENLERLMAQKNITQSDLAEAIGVGQPAISMMLAQLPPPAPDHQQIGRSS